MVPQRLSSIPTIIEICLGCNGETRLRNHKKELTDHKCPWCNATGKVVKDINDLFLRVEKATCNNHRCGNVFNPPQPKSHHDPG